MHDCIAVLARVWSNFSAITVLWLFRHMNQSIWCNLCCTREVTISLGILFTQKWLWLIWNTHYSFLHLNAAFHSAHIWSLMRWFLYDWLHHCHLVDVHLDEVLALSSAQVWLAHWWLSFIMLCFTFRSMLHEISWVSSRVLVDWYRCGRWPSGMFMRLSVFTLKKMHHLVLTAQFLYVRMVYWR